MSGETEESYGWGSLPELDMKKSIRIRQPPAWEVGDNVNTRFVEAVNDDREIEQDDNAYVMREGEDEWNQESWENIQEKLVENGDDIEQVVVYGETFDGSDAAQTTWPVEYRVGLINEEDENYVVVDIPSSFRLRMKGPGYFKTTTGEEEVPDDLFPERSTMLR